MDQQLVPHDTDLEHAEERGRNLYRTNPHFKKLAHVMEHPEMKDFFKTYMTDWDSTKMIIMFMKIYVALEHESTVELTPYQKIAIVKDVIDDGEMRRKVVVGIQQWTNQNPPTSLLIDTNRNYIESSTVSKREPEDFP